MSYQKGLVAFVAVLCIANAAADELTAMIERDLAALGYDTGSVDGEADMRTAIAISQFQAENGLEVTGEVSPQLAGILANEVKQSGTSAQTPATAAATTTSTASTASEQACLQQKIAAAEQQQASKKKGLGGMFSSLSKTVAKYGNNDLAEVTSEVYEASATVNDLAAAARDLGITESEIAECTSGSSSQVATAAGAVTGGTAIPTTQEPAAVPATAAASSVAQTGGYAGKAHFASSITELSAFDAGIEKCQGQRGDYRSRFDSLVSAAHPDFRTEAMSRYDQNYSGMKQIQIGLPSGTSSMFPCSDLERIKASADRTLNRLGANCATASQCAEGSTQTSIPATGSSSSSQVAAASATDGYGAVISTSTAAQPAGPNVRYAEQGAFQSGSFMLGQFDAMVEACTGTRPGFRAEVESLVTEAHPGYRAEALSLYDSQYQSTSQAAVNADGECLDAQVANIRRQADTTLENLRPKVLPSPPAVQSAAAASAGASSSSQVTTTSATGAVIASGGSDGVIDEGEADPAAAASSDPTGYLASSLPTSTYRPTAQSCDYEIRQDRLFGVCAHGGFEFSIRDIGSVQFSGMVRFKCKDDTRCLTYKQETSNGIRGISFDTKYDAARVQALGGLYDYMQSLKTALEAWAASEGASIAVECHHYC
jgi:peptidoglycan hydrolase-like protein with peptidoglycan-binding domain